MSVLVTPLYKILECLQCWNRWFCFRTVKLWSDLVLSKFPWQMIHYTITITPLSINIDNFVNKQTTHPPQQIRKYLLPDIIVYWIWIQTFLDKEYDKHFWNFFLATQHILTTAYKQHRTHLCRWIIMKAIQSLLTAGSCLIAPLTACDLLLSSFTWAALTNICHRAVGMRGSFRLRRKSFIHPHITCMSFIASLNVNR